MNFGQKSLKLNIRLVYCSRHYGILDMRVVQSYALNDQSFFFIFLDFNITMNSFAFATIFALFVAFASATFDATTGVFTLGAVALNGGNSLALISGQSVLFLTSAGIVAGGLGLLALGLVKAAILAGPALADAPCGRSSDCRSKRSAPVEQLAAIDEYFATIADMDVDDCGKLLVCQLESIPREVR